MLGFRPFSSSEHADYRFGFNGMEKDDEIKGNGNSLDFGARILDPRVGKFLSTDPFEGKLPQYSPYTAMGNNPIFYIDVDGKYFTGDTDFVVDLYAQVSAIAAGDGIYADRAKKFKAALERMDESDIEFFIEVDRDVQFIGQAEHGETSFDFENNRVTIEVTDYFQDRGPSPTEANGAHELEHGRQFMDNEILYGPDANGKGIGVLPVLDQTDEHNAIDVQNVLTENDPTRTLTDEKIKQQKDLYKDLSPIAKTLGKDEASYLIGKHGKNKMMTGSEFVPTEKQKADKKPVLKK